MRVPMSWLREYVDIDIPTRELADRLSAAGVAIEHVEQRNPGLSGIVVGHIQSIEKHPDADRLRIAQVDVGQATLQIVTAAANVQPGDTIPLAVVGARVMKTNPDGTSGPTMIGKGKLRGVPSDGMMCSANELALSAKDLPQEQREGVMLLPADTPPGGDVLKLMGIDEEVLIVEPFANRPDYLSLYGIAREVAAVLGTSLKPLSLDYEEVDEAWVDLARVEILDPDLCSRYIARVVTDVDVGPSPLWMQGRLTAAGIRAINRVVDVTNYVMVEVGQPLHAFDYAKLEQQRIVVRRARSGETMKTLDGVDRVLNETQLVIADARNPVAIAGVMGGLDTEVSDATRRILLESAHFNPATVRRTSQSLGLRSESSRRFEKGLSYDNVDVGSRRACALMARLGCKVSRGAIDAGTPPAPSAPVAVTADRVEQVLGIRIPEKRMRQVLESLEFAVQARDGKFSVQVPTFRQDVRRDVDLIEEIARHHGYDNIPMTVPSSRAVGRSAGLDPGEEWLRDTLVRAGLTETITPTLYRTDTLSRLGFPTPPQIRVHNPLTEDQGVIRSTVLPHLLQVAGHNARSRQEAVRIFEVSKIYLPEDAGGNGAAGGPRVSEVRRLGVLLWDAAGTTHFPHGRGVLESLSQEVGASLELMAAEVVGLHPGKTARVRIGGQDAGFVGILHPRTAEDLELPGEVVLAEIDYTVLLAARTVKKYRPVPRFPESSRDLAFIFNEAIFWGQVEAIVREASGDLLQKVTCFDIYRGEQIPPGSKSMAFRMIFQSAEHTLTDGEIEAVVERIVKELSARLEGKPRM